MAAPGSQHRALLYDGVSARPRPGSVDLLGDALAFRGESGVHLEWSLARVRSIDRVAGELHVEIATDDAPAGTGPPALKLVVEDSAFEARLDEARIRFDAGLRVASGVAARRLGIRGWLVIAALVIPAAWLGVTVALPHAHVLISRDAEAALGEKLYGALAKDWQTIDDQDLADLANRMVAELTEPGAGFDVRVTFVRDETPNAFAAPGGRIVVFAGLIGVCPSADALAAVLAHEIVHVEQRHGLKHLLRTLGVIYFAGCAVGGGVEEFATAEAIAEMSSLLAVLKHSRDHEREADRLALHKLERAGRSTAGLHEFFRALQVELPKVAGSIPAWISTHPPTAERIELGRSHADAGPPARPWLEPDAWEELRARVGGRARKR